MCSVHVSMPPLPKFNKVFPLFFDVTGTTDEGQSGDTLILCAGWGTDY